MKIREKKTMVVEQLNEIEFDEDDLKSFRDAVDLPTDEEDLIALLEFIEAEYAQDLYDFLEESKIAKGLGEEEIECMDYGYRITK